MFPLVPSAPPEHISCIALSAVSIQISWRRPPKEAIHGELQGYKLMYEHLNVDSDEYVGRVTKTTTTLSTVVHQLSPYTNYSVRSTYFSFVLRFCRYPAYLSQAKHDSSYNSS